MEDFSHKPFEKLDRDFLNEFYPSRVRVSRYFLYQDLHHQLREHGLTELSGQGLAVGGESLACLFFPSIKWDTTRFDDGFDVRDMSNVEEKYDLVIFDQVLEYVDFPWIVPEQLSSVTATGAHCVIMAPFLYPAHCDQDYYRFTASGLSKLFSFFFDCILTGISGSSELLRYIQKLKVGQNISSESSGEDIEVPTVEFLQKYKQWSMRDNHNYTHCWYVGKRKW
jgi:hypothetical protein